MRVLGKPSGGSSWTDPPCKATMLRNSFQQRHCSVFSALLIAQLNARLECSLVCSTEPRAWTLDHLLLPLTLQGRN